MYFDQLELYLEKRFYLKALNKDYGYLLWIHINNLYQYMDIFAYLIKISIIEVHYTYLITEYQLYVCIRYISTLCIL